MWEIEFSNATDQAVLLPPPGVSKRRANKAKSKTTADNGSGGGCGGGDNDDGCNGNDNVKNIGNSTGTPISSTGTPSYSGERCCYSIDPSSEANNHQYYCHNQNCHHHHHQQHRLSSARHGSGGEQKLVRVHSLGSAKFLFDSTLDHHKSGLSARTRSNGSDVSAGGRGEGGSQYPSAISDDVWGTQNENTSSFNNNSGGSGPSRRGININSAINSSSSRSRWGKENAMLKINFNPFKLAEGAANELPPASVQTANSAFSTAVASAFATTDTPRYIPSSASQQVPLDCGRRKVSQTIGKKPLCGSTWLGPEVSPLPSDRDPRLTHGGVNFEASPWSGPRRIMKLRRGRKVINGRREVKRGNGMGKEGELELECGMRWKQRRRCGGDQQRVASISETRSTAPSGQQAFGLQVTTYSIFR